MENKPRLRRIFDIVDLGSQGVLFKSEHTSVKLEGPDIQEFVQKVVPLLDGTRTVKQIHECLSEYNRQDIDNGIGLLIESGLIEQGGENENYRYPQLEFMRDVGFSKELTIKKLKSLTIAVFGLGAHGGYLVAALANEGVGRIKCFDPSKVTMEDKYLSGQFKDADVGKSREDVSVEYFRRVFPNVKFETSGVQDPTEKDVEDWIKDCDFAICCMDKSYNSFYYWLNRAALKTNLHWCAASLDGVELVVGPLIIPGDTACYMCYKMRLVANEKSYQDAIAYEKYLSERKKDEVQRRSILAINAGLLGHLLALESLKHTLGFAASPLAGRICVVDSLRLTSEFHTILQRPDCPHCGSIKKKMSLIKKEDVDILDLESILVSPRVGIIKGLCRLLKDALEPESPFVFGVGLSNFNFEANLDSSSLSCSGKGLTMQKAKVSALGEAVERYCGGQYDESTIILAQYQHLSDAIDPRKLVLFSTEQYLSKGFPYSEFREDQTMGWTQGFSLYNGKLRLVPSIAVYLNYRPSCKEENLFPQTSNGLAAGSSFEQALLKGLLEVVERDAFLISWLCRLPMPLIDLKDICDPGTRRLIDMYERRGVAVSVNALMLDTNITTYLACGVDLSGKSPAVAVGLSANPNPEMGIRGAIEEVGQIRPHLSREMRKPDYIQRLSSLDDFGNVKTIQDHELLYTDPKRLCAFNFLLKNNRSISLSDLPRGTGGNLIEELDWCKNQIANLGVELIGVNLTTPDIGSLGLSVARVMITEFQPMHFGFNERRLGGKRLFELPKKLGFSDKILSRDDLNPFPHPLG
jgi:ribosomal protein S12 methylthiotransferase accessory factor